MNRSMASRMRAEVRLPESTNDRWAGVTPLISANSAAVISASANALRNRRLRDSGEGAIVDLVSLSGRRTAADIQYTPEAYLSSPDLTTFAGRLTHARVTAGTRLGKVIPKAELARQAGVSGSSYGAYEEGTARPSWEIAARLADYLAVGRDWLLLGTGAMEDRATPDDVAALLEVVEKMAAAADSPAAPAPPRPRPKAG